MSHTTYYTLHISKLHTALLRDYKVHTALSASFITNQNIGKILSNATFTVRLTLINTHQTGLKKEPHPTTVANSKPETSSPPSRQWPCYLQKPGDDASKLSLILL